MFRKFVSAVGSGILVVVFLIGCEQPKEAAVNKTTSVPEKSAMTVYGKPIKSTVTAKVTNISDGDTIDVLTDDGKKLEVRMESVDAPEGNAPFSDMVSKNLADMLQDKKVDLLVTGEDRRGRTLAFVSLNGVNVSAYLIENGFAKHFKRYSQDSELAALESAARQKKLNIWADPVAADPNAESDGNPEGDMKPLQAGLSFFTWNVESDGADPDVIASQLAELGGHTIYGLAEVDKNSFEKLRSALGDTYKSIKGTHKHNDYLQLIYDNSKLELLGWNEIDEVGDIRMNRSDRGLRSPLLAKFKQREGDAEFHVVVNHLARGDEKLRAKQAAGLREWARTRTVPMVCIGDFNFDYVFATRKGNESFDEFMRDGVWSWIQPEEMIDTNWYDEAGDGTDDYPGSMLDFMFVAGAAKDLDWKCNVIVRDGDFPDDESTSDHRPVVMELSAQ